MNVELSYPLAFSAGLLSFLSPCVLPLMPIYLGYLTGAGAGNRNVDAAQGRRFTLAHGVAFVVGFTLVFMAWGAIGGAIGDFVRNPWFVRIGAILLFVMGLHLLGVVQIPLLYMEKRLEMQRGANPNIFSSLMIGATFGAGWTPCVGPVLGAIWMLAAQNSSAMQGSLLLLAYSLGLGIPFLIGALGLGQASSFIRRMGPYLRYIEIASGVLVILIAVLLFTGRMTALNNYFYELTPQWLIERL